MSLDTFGQTVVSARRLWVNKIILNSNIDKHLFSGYSALIYGVRVNSGVPDFSISTATGDYIVSSKTLSDFNTKIRTAIKNLRIADKNKFSINSLKRIEVYFIGPTFDQLSTKEAFTNERLYPDLEFKPIKFDDYPDVIFVYNESVNVPKFISYFGTYVIPKRMFSSITLLFGYSKEELRALIQEKGIENYDRLISNPGSNTNGSVQIAITHDKGVPAPLTIDMYFAYIANAYGDVSNIDTISNIIYLPNISPDNLIVSEIAYDDVFEDDSLGLLKVKIERGRLLDDSLRSKIDVINTKRSTMTSLPSTLSSETILTEPYFLAEESRVLTSSPTTLRNSLNYTDGSTLYRNF